MCCAPPHEDHGNPHDHVTCPDKTVIQIAFFVNRMKHGNRSAASLAVEWPLMATTATWTPDWVQPYPAIDPCDHNKVVSAPCYAIDEPSLHR